MRIERIQVEEGFLDGLDLSLTPGLNVLIGPRGSGKTSVIELIRFCLGVPGMTHVQGEKATKHAVDILGSGQVTVVLREHGETIKVSRTVQESRPRATSDFSSPLIVSQNEVEVIGIHATSRLELIDRFRVRSTDRVSDADLSMIRSLTAEIQSETELLRDIEDAISQLAETKNELDDLLKAQTEALSELDAKKAEQDRLGFVTDEISKAGVRRDLIDSALQDTTQRLSELAQVVSRMHALPPWPDSAGETDWLKDAREVFEEVKLKVGDAIDRGADLQRILDQLNRRNHDESLERESEARDLRKILESAQAGAGEIQRRIGTLKNQVARLNGLQARKKEKQQQLAEIKARRAASLDLFEDASAQIYAERKDAVQGINTDLGPEIRADLIQASRFDDYRAAIANTLRGAGLQQNVWAPKIAESLSPREFVEAVESGDTDVFVRNVSRMTDRQANKLISHVSGTELASILTCSIEDDVVLNLFDGEDYKPTQELSVGQRCTVVLPMLLRDQAGPLIVDQPEDHLDNAYIVRTLVAMISEQKSDTQMIFSSHNANIPVLGEAENVVVLGSDGHRAFVRSAEDLENPESVKAITSLMEGGIAAFERRAAFYRDHPTNG